MTRHPESEVEDEERIGCFRLLTRFVWTLLVCALILVVAALFFVGTDGFRAFFAGRAEVAWRVPFRIGQSGFDPDGSIRLENVEAGSGSEQIAVGFRAEEMGLHGNPLWFIWNGATGGLHRLEAKHWELVFVQDREGDWRPARLQAANRWINQALKLGLEIPEEGEGAAGKIGIESMDWTGLRMTDGLLRWVDPEGQELARIEGAQIDATPLDLPGRKALHVRFAAAQVVTRGRSAGGAGMELEVLRTEEQDIVLREEALEGRASLIRSERPPRVSTEPEEALAPVEVPTAPEVLVEPLSDEEAQKRVRSELLDALTP